MSGRRVTELFERPDDPDDRSEETDEGRVVSERAEIREPALEPPAFERRSALHGPVSGSGSSIREPQPRCRDGSRDGFRSAKLFDGGGVVARGEMRIESFRHCLEVTAS